MPVGGGETERGAADLEISGWVLTAAVLHCSLAKLQSRFRVQFWGQLGKANFIFGFIFSFFFT